MGVGLGFGLAANAGPDVARVVAPAIERLGYETIWTNDTRGADGVAVARALLEGTSRAAVGIGVLACDRRPADEIVAAVRGLAEGRLILGIGSGGSARPLADVRTAVAALRAAGIGPIAVAALGPRMCRLAGEIADVVLLNWMTPERIRWARDRIAEGARRARRDPASVRVAAYVRVAIGDGAAERLAAEAERYARIPAYARTFSAMGLEPGVVGVAVAEGDLGDRVRSTLAPYRALLDETVVRALPGSWTAVEIMRTARAGLG